MTDIALKEYFDRRLTDLDRLFQQRLDDLDRRLTDRFHLNDAAVNEARKVISERLASMNEFRDALRDQANRMATRLELEAVDKDVQQLQLAKSNLDGRLVMVSGVISAAVAIGLWMLSRFLPTS